MKEIIVEVPDKFGKTLKPEKMNTEIKGELVRCKNCKYGAPTIINGIWLSVTCGDVDHRPDWFCADGKRRDDDA